MDAQITGMYEYTRTEPFNNQLNSILAQPIKFNAFAAN
jgi:hypothetical protein